MRYELVPSVPFTDHDGEEQSTYPMVKWRCRHCGVLNVPYIPNDDGSPPAGAIEWMIGRHDANHRP